MTDLDLLGRLGAIFCERCKRLKTDDGFYFCNNCMKQWMSYTPHSAPNECIELFIETGKCCRD